MKFRILLSMLCIRTLAIAQPQIQWEKSFGGSLGDQAYSIIQTRDGGFAFTGWAGSSDSDLTSNQGAMDVWVVKLDALGNLIWQKNIGGSNNELGNSIVQTKDGGFAVAGYTNSTNGDVTGNHGSSDFWVLKIDSLGNLIWKKCFGGSLSEDARSIKETPDHGFIVVGGAESIDGNVTGNHGINDFWIIKIDSVGSLQWQKCLGGSNTESAQSVIQKLSGNYVIAGITYSNDFDVTSNHGLQDFWVLEIDTFGNIIWQKTYGGTSNDFGYSVDLFNYFSNPDTVQGLIVSGYAQSNDGDVTGNHGTDDSWIIKLDSVGNILWEKSYGGSDQDQAFSVIESLNHDFVFCGYARSNDFDVLGNHGPPDYWIVDIDSSNNLIWQLPLGGTSSDLAQEIHQTTDGGYIIAGYSDSNDGNVTGNNGGQDCWIVKLGVPPSSSFTTATPLCPGTCTPFTNLSTNATSYQWYFPGAIPDSSSDVNPQNICYNTPGSYDVTLIASNANGSDTLSLANYITVFPYPPPQGISQNGDTLFANQGTVSYQWYFNGNLISAATNYFYVAQASGDYNVVATDANGCEVEAVIFNVIASVQAAESSSSMQVFPNPVMDKFTIQNLIVTSGTTVEISICNMLGEKIFEKEITTSEKQLDISFLHNGIYLLRIETNGKVFVRKLVKM